MYVQLKKSVITMLVIFLFENMMNYFGKMYYCYRCTLYSIIVY